MMMLCSGLPTRYNDGKYGYDDNPRALVVGQVRNGSLRKLSL